VSEHVSEHVTDLRRELQASLGSAYTLERELGGGGMSRVFVATETALGRRVVVKVLSPGLALGLSAERFAREIKLAAALQHPHIVPVLAAGEAGGLPFYTMPYVDGESLRARLLHGEPPSFSETIGILTDVALALEYAHTRGVVHRDIKPENVLLSGRTAIVADFGIAKAVSAARTQLPGATITSAGQSLGTPAYMAPEQAGGDPTDQRADLYAWGLMAYELLAGHHPFADKASTRQLLTAQMVEKPLELAERRPGLPPPLAALVMRCLEKDPAARPQGAGELLEALDGITSPGAGLPNAATPAPATAPVPAVAGSPARRPPAVRFAVRAGVAAVALGAAVVFLSGRDRALPGAGATAPTASSAAGTAPPRRLAVLPFDNLGDTADAYFADGMTDAVRGKLAELSGVQVIARASSEQYRDSDRAPAEIAKELGVRYLLTGAVRWARVPGDDRGPSRVQVSPELVEIGTDGVARVIWNRGVDADLADVFKVQGEIAEKVVAAMRVALGSADQQRVRDVPIADAAAYDAYLRGEAAWNAGASVDPPSLRRAIAFFEQAVARDSSFAEAWGALSIASSLLNINSAPTESGIRRAREAAERAHALDQGGAIGHRAMSTYYVNIEHDNTRALQEIETALQTSPGDAVLLTAAANAKEGLGRFEDALRDRQASVALDPRSPSRWAGLTGALLRLRRYPEARAAGERALALAPTALSSIQDRIMVELGDGKLAAARQLMANAKRDVAPDVLAAYLATYNDLGWALDAEGEGLLLAAGPEAFDDDRATWALVRAQQYHWRGALSQSRAWGDSASAYLSRQLQDAPDDAQLHALNALALAYAGRKGDAIAEGERAARLQPLATNFVLGAYNTHLLARTYLLTGEQEKALDLLEQLLDMPHYLSPGWLRIDPTWQVLRGNPRFERLTSAR